jgi:tight adherence protein B
VTAVLCVALAGAAVGLAVPPRSTVGQGTPAPGWMRVAVPVLAVAGVGWWAADRPQLLVLLAIGGAAVGAAVRLVVARRADREAARARGRVVELCDALHGELAAGQTPVAALQRATTEWPDLEPVTRVAVAGGDVPAALRDAARLPGAGDLRILAAAWQVAHRTGHGLGEAVARVAAELRAGEQTRRVVRGELASARATARLVAALPLAALALGGGAGGEPWAFLLGHPVGLACLAGGLACGIAGLAWIEALARDVERGR